jgi:hypothetical protein
MTGTFDYRENAIRRADGHEPVVVAIAEYFHREDSVHQGCELGTAVPCASCWNRSGLAVQALTAAGYRIVREASCPP